MICSDGSSLNNRADLAPGVPVVTSSGSTVSRLNDYFNAAAFENVSDPCSEADKCRTPFRTSSRNFPRGPGQKNVDLGVIKLFSVTEKWKIEFRGEFFNIFNLVSFVPPNHNAFCGRDCRREASGPSRLAVARQLSFTPSR